MARKVMALRPRSQQPAYEVRLNPVDSISNLVAGSNHHEVFRRTASVVLSIFAHQSLPHRIAREPEATRGTSRTRTRGPDRSFNDDLVDIQVPAPASFHLQEGLGVDAGLLEDCTQRSLSGMSPGWLGMVV